MIEALVVAVALLLSVVVNRVVTKRSEARCREWIRAAQADEANRKSEPAVRPAKRSPMSTEELG